MPMNERTTVDKDDGYLASMLCKRVDVLNENTSDNGTFRGILLQSIA